MKRKLTLAMLITLSASSHLAVALGVGEVEVRSTLNAPLRASIPLTDAAGLEPDQIRVSIADDQAYAAAGLTRTPLVASVRLAVSERQGRLMLDMTSERSIREPWLDLLLRLTWPSGQQLREVTLLLDPPDYGNMPVLVMGGANAGRFAGSPPVRPDIESSSRSVSRTPPNEESTTSARVSSGDTLWVVAGRLRPDSGISMDQMMVALVEANPDVFPSGNINAMRAGFELVVPPRDAIAARSAAEAQRIVQSMNQAWANRGSGGPARVALNATQSTEVEVMASTTASPSSPESAGNDGSIGDVENGSDEPATTAERTPSNAQGARLTLLTDAQAAASSEDATVIVGGGDSEVEQDSSIESGEPRSATSGQQVAISPDVLEALYGGESELSRDARLLRLESRWVESREMLEEVSAERDELQASLGDMRAELDAMRDRLAALSAGRQGDEAPGAGGVVAPDAVSNQSAEAPWWGAIYQADTNRTLMLGGGVLAVLLALWALVRHRRQRGDNDEHTFDNIQVVGPHNTGMISPKDSAQKEGHAAPVRASMPQAEAINEADIFIAYGRFDQARELLEGSLEREPDRDDLRLKLLMVHLKQGNREDATRQAERLEASSDPAIRAEVTRLMGKVGNASPLAAGSGDRFPTVGFPTADSRNVEAKAQATSSEMPEHREDSMSTPDDAEKEAMKSGLSWSRAPVSSHESAAQASESQAIDGNAEPQRSDAEGLYRHGETSPLAERSTDSVTQAEPAASTAPELTSRQDEQGRDIIDYRPPSLDPAPAARPETPMQPSIEFTSSAQASSDLAEPAEASPSTAEPIFANDLPQDWEVEEVAFPPLDQDNGAPASGASSASAELDEARGLLHTGDTDRARTLLKHLADGDDAKMREEAQSLLTRHDL